MIFSWCLLCTSLASFKKVVKQQKSFEEHSSQNLILPNIWATRKILLNFSCKKNFTRRLLLCMFWCRFWYAWKLILDGSQIFYRNFRYFVVSNKFGIFYYEMEELQRLKFCFGRFLLLLEIILMMEGLTSSHTWDVVGRRLGKTYYWVG